MATEAEERAAAEAAGLDYDALSLASMVADYMRGVKPQLHELPASARVLITAYLCARDGFPGALDGRTMRHLPVLPHIDRGKYAARAVEDGSIIEGEIIDGG